MNNQYLFNVMYYDGLYKGDIASAITDINKKLIEYRLNKDDIPPMGFEGESFRLRTVYPGLLIGTGNPHSSGDNNEEIKLGFTLDYTTGLPYIPGSTVKGVIRSLFKENDKKKENETEDSFNNRKEAYANRLEYIRELIKDLPDLIVDDDKLSDDNLKLFEKETFGDNENGKGDIFFDSFPVSGGHDNRLFSFESITPHSMFKDPVPLRLLKIIPGVVFEFRFIIRDSEVIEELTADKKEMLFKRIITDIGIGAKTNVGFGVMEEFDGSPASNGNCVTNEKAVIVNKVQPNSKKPGAYVAYFEDGMAFDVPSDIKPGDSITITVTSEKNGKIYGNFKSR